MTSRLLRGLAAMFILLAMGCKDEPGTGDTSGVALYAFDSTTSSVMVWSDLGALYDSTTTPPPSYTFSHDLFKKVTNLAWGGMCLDAQRGVLYMVAADTGTVVRLSNLRSQSGAIPTADIASFQLNPTEHLQGGIFGQATIDTQTNNLMITESGDSSTQIWVVANASTPQPDSVPLTALKLSGDNGGTGIAAASGAVYAYMNDGAAVGVVTPTTGPRLRRGNASAFDPNLVILGDKTGLQKYGTLALDTANGYLFVGVHNVDSALTTSPILVFQAGQFGSGGYNQAPNRGALGSATGQATLRVLSHAGNKDWLVGLRGQGTTGYADLLLWKAPMSGTEPAVRAVTGSVFKGVALDGNAS